jgi:hypothetical protein
MGIDEAEESMRGAWAASGWRTSGQEGGGGSPAPSSTTDDQASALGMGALALLGLMWLGTSHVDRALRRAGA